MDSNTIIADSYTIVRQRQLAIRREMDRRGIALKVVAMDAGMSYPTLLSYFPAEGSRDPAVIPMAAVYQLVEGKAIPPDLLSILLPPGFVIVQVPEGVDYDDVSAVCREFIDTKERAHHPESEAGRDIGPGEQAVLGAKVVRLRA